MGFTAATSTPAMALMEACARVGLPLRDRAFFIVSDFLEEDISHPLKLLAQHHDVVAVTVDDPSERDLPNIGIARLVDPETGETFEVDTSSPNVRSVYSQRVLAEREARKHLLRRLAIDEVPVHTEGGVVEPLLRFFRTRETRLRR